MISRISRICQERSEEVRNVSTKSRRALFNSKANGHSSLQNDKTEDDKYNTDSFPNKAWNFIKKSAPYVAGAVAAPVAVPLVLNAVGFTGVGIAAGSVAATMMSLAGGGAVAGSVVAVCQSVGMAGLGVGGTAAASAAGVGVVAATKNVGNKIRSKWKGDTKLRSKL